MHDTEPTYLLHGVFLAGIGVDLRLVGKDAMPFPSLMRHLVNREAVDAMAIGSTSASCSKLRRLKGRFHIPDDEPRPCAKGVND